MENQSPGNQASRLGNQAGNAGKLSMMQKTIWQLGKGTGPVYTGLDLIRGNRKQVGDWVKQCR